MLQEIKARIRSAMLSKNEAVRNILRVVLGEAQTLESRQGKISNEDIHKIIKKIIEGNNETIALASGDAKLGLQRENLILSGLLPRQLSLAEMESSLSMHISDIRAAKNDGQATGVAMKVFKSCGASVDGKVVAELVKKIRS